MTKRIALFTLMLGVIVMIATSCDSGKAKFKLNDTRGWYFIIIDDSIQPQKADKYYLFNEHNVSYIPGDVLDGGNGVDIYQPDGHKLKDGEYKYLRYSQAPSFFMYCLYYPEDAELHTGETDEDQKAKELLLNQARSQLIKDGIVY